MSKIKNLSEHSFLKLFFFGVSLSFLIAAFLMPDRERIFTGFYAILSNPTKLSANFFDTGGYAATFLNMGLVGLVCAGLYCLPGDSKNNPTATLVTLLTIGFAAWGLNFLNIWPGILGVALYAFVKQEKMGNYSNAMLFSTGLAPVTSEMMLRYPITGEIGFTVHGYILAVTVGLIIGFFLPAGLENSPKVHKGMDLYSAALPVGMTAFFLQGLFYKAPGIEIPAAVGGDMSVESPLIVNGFCAALFLGAILLARLMGCKYQDYRRLLTNPHPVTDYAATYGNATMLMNFGVYGLFILVYYNLVGARFNAATFGTILSMVSACNSGSNPANAIPIIFGYAGASLGLSGVAHLFGGDFSQTLDAQPIVVGLCYASGLAPISDHYGWKYGMFAAFAHYCMVTTVPQMHGGLCLYNGGFTAALVCLLLVPGLEKLFRTKHQRRGIPQPENHK